MKINGEQQTLQIILVKIKIALKILMNRLQKKMTVKINL